MKLLEILIAWLILVIGMGLVISLVLGEQLGAFWAIVMTIAIVPDLITALVKGEVM